MYICRDCGLARAELPTVREYHGDDYFYETRANTDCPACGARDGMLTEIEYSILEERGFLK